ncbi:MAG: hypothetical protein HRT61_11095, partial [Ekhidna sp.]|nr:hypothetical protein [Ekhidna sp.]
SVLYYDVIAIPFNSTEIQKKIADQNGTLRWVSNEVMELTEFEIDDGLGLSYKNYPTKREIHHTDGTIEEVRYSYTAELAPSSEPPSNSSDGLKTLYRKYLDNSISSLETTLLVREVDDADFFVLSSQLRKQKYDEVTGVNRFDNYQLSLNTPLPHDQFNYIGTNNTNIVNDSRYELVSTQSYNSDGLLSTAKNLVSDQITNYQYDTQGYLMSAAYDPTNNNRRTIYDYSLVGVQSEIDMNDRSIVYVYDDQNRLYYIMDDDDNILRRYRYNYGSEENKVSADIHISGTTLTNSFMTFSAQNVKMYGNEATYKWRIGSTTYTGESIANIAFAEEGIKEITLNIINPEYDEPFEKTLSIAIVGSLRNPEIGGPSTFDKCLGTGPIIFDLNASGGGAICFDGDGSGNYGEWFYKTSSGSYYSLGFSGRFPDDLLQDPDTYTIKYVFRDECGNTYEDTHTFIVKDDSCNGPGGATVE